MRFRKWWDSTKRWLKGSFWKGIHYYGYSKKLSTTERSDREKIGKEIFYRMWKEIEKATDKGVNFLTTSIVYPSFWWYNFHYEKDVQGIDGFD